MNRLTVKQLQNRCRELGLKASGNKQQLIDRLEFQSAQNSMNVELTKRVRELEATLSRMQARPGSESESEIETPLTNGFQPPVISSPCVPTMSTALPQPVTCVQGSILNTQTEARPLYSQATSIPVSAPPNNPTLCAPPNNPTFFAPPNNPTFFAPPNNPTLLAPQQYQPLHYPTYIPVSSLGGYATQNIEAPSYQAPGYPTTGSPFMNIKDMVSVLPEFHPMAEDSLTSLQFVQRVQLLKNAYQWRDDLVVFAVQQKLKGHAKMWSESQREVYTSWQQFSTKLVQAFPFDDNAATAHIQMANTKREANETPQNYYFRMLAIGIKFGLPDSAVARHIINGINENELKRKISNEYESCAALLRDIDCYCRYNEVKTVNTKPKEYVRPVSANQTNTTQHYGATHDGARHMKCYNCGKYGHISAKCRAPKRAGGNSGTVGQAPARPVNNEPRNVARTNVNNVQTENAAKPEIVKEVKINNSVLKALIDPGSSHSLIRASNVNNLHNGVACNIPLVGFGGGQYVCTKMVSVVMNMDNHEMRADLLVVDDILLQYDVLIGRNIICQNGKRMIIEEDTCWIEEVENLSSRAKDLSTEDYKELKVIINKYKGRFATNIEELGTCSIKKMQIKVTSEKPINMKPYRIAFAQRVKVREMIEELMRAKIIRPSVSPYASPVVVVPKKNGELRLCVDYRQLNKITEREPYPMPVIDEHMALLAGNKYFTTVDLKMGYHQVEVEEESKKYTAFVTTEGHYEYERMPFGLVNAPAVFQSIINTITNAMEPGEILAYLDDIVIPSKTVESGLQRLQKFLSILTDAGLTLRLDKCNFLTTQITYLGHEISADGVTPGQHKIGAVKNFPVPKSISEVRRFLGLTGFFRKFICDYALISRPLTALLHKSEVGNFKWEEAQKNAFHKLINILCEKPLLTLYDFNAFHEVHTDACSVGLAGVLLQSADKKNWRPVLYFSRQCTDCESRYHAYELETLAVVETLTRFRIYVLGKRFTLVTDCSAIAKAKDKKELIPKIARWYMRLLEFDCEMVHRSGQRLAHVDALSRAPTEPPCEVETAGFVLNVAVGDQDWILSMQLQDPQLMQIISVLNGENSSEQESQIRTDYKLKNGRLYRKKNGLKLVVPKNVRWRIVKLCHDDVGHFALEKTIERIEQKFWFPRIRKYVREYIAACIQCCYNKTQGGKSEGQLHFADIEPIPFVTIHLDHLGPFTKSSKGMSYVLVIADAFSKYVVVKAVRNTKSVPVITALNELTSYFGLPKRVITDRGTAFTSKLFEDYCLQHDIQHIKTAVRSPRANGQAERANQLILNFLRTSVVADKQWDQHLRELQWSINTQKNATSGFTPNQLVFDFDLRDVVRNHMLAAVHEENSSEIPISERRNLAAQRIEEKRAEWKKRFDTQHKQPHVYGVNDLVVVAYEPAATGNSRKLEPKFRGPYLIAKVLPNDRYVITDVPGMQITQRNLNTVYAADKLKPWCYDSPELADGNSDTDDDGDDLEDDAKSGEAELSSAHS